MTREAEDVEDADLVRWIRVRGSAKTEGGAD